MRLIWMSLFLTLRVCASASGPVPQAELPPTGTITYLPPLAEVTLVTASGQREPQSDSSETARINLANALSNAVPADAFDQSDEGQERAKFLAIKLEEAAVNPGPVQTSEVDTPEHLVALIQVRFDVESSASKLLQGGLNLMFGGVPGPDGIDQTAQIALFAQGTDDLVWSRTLVAQDPRTPDDAERLINELIATSSQDTEF